MIMIAGRTTNVGRRKNQRETTQQLKIEKFCLFWALVTDAAGVVSQLKAQRALTMHLCFGPATEIAGIRRSRWFARIAPIAPQFRSCEVPVAQPEFAAAPA